MGTKGPLACIIAFAVYIGMANFTWAQLPRPRVVPTPKPPIPTPKPLRDLERQGRQQLNQLDKQGRQQLNRIDPTAQLVDRWKRERQNAERGLSRLDPNWIVGMMRRALAESRNRAIADPRTKELDLRQTPIGSTLQSALYNFTQGNKKQAEVVELTYNVQSEELRVRLRARHCHSWGHIPGMGNVDLYSVTQTASCRFNFKNNVAEFDINPGQLGPRINSRTLVALAKGDLVGAGESAAPGGIGTVINYERVNQYDDMVRAYQARFGSQNIYFASKQFVDTASPATLRKYLINGYLTGGLSLAPQIMADLKEQAQKEGSPLVAWLQQRGVVNAHDVADDILAGRQPRVPHIQFEMPTVRYSARERPVGLIQTPWRHENHLAFVVVWRPR